MDLAHVSRVWQWGSVGVAKCVRRREGPLFACLSFP